MTFCVHFKPHGDCRCMLPGGLLCLECDGCGEVLLKEEAAVVLLLQNNEGCHTTEGMIGNASLLAAVLTVVSVVSLSVVSVLCLRCRRKSKIIHEEHQVYNPQTFQREGSVFAVTQSKTVTRANQISSTTVEIQELPQAEIDDQSDYENISDAQVGTHVEHTYVAPLPNSLYVNEEKSLTDADQTPDVYANIITSLPIAEDDDDDYENAQFLDEAVQEQEDDEPDYVNENGDCT
ncbi:uncharacterized protein LOC113142634 isoform X1 [Mastacembelus armatus]|uniref:uncharacterized protein LOC113142634 isoform X1 n=1 Tax=Mastacembelus armatus TaxID=205130 RepID=UPI000E45F8FD|nr:uncharacterized protein LOC113142634 isoform X1 [Mastacembelus armatus]